MVRLLLICIWGLACASAATAQPASGPAPAGGGWHSLRVPGGVPALLKAAGLDESLPRTRALREVVRVVYDVQDGVSDALDARRRAVLAYLESISAVEAVRPVQGQPPLIVKQADDRNVRRRLEAVAEAIGCSLERDAGVYRLQADRGDRQKRRRADLASAGLDVDALVASANTGEPITLSLKTDSVPLPLSPETWTGMLRVPEKLAGSLLTGLLGDRGGALVYLGLLGADAPTREFFERNPQLLKQIVESDRAAVLAAIGQGIRVAGGRVAVPGGAAAEPLWQEVAGESPGRPDRFLLRLLDKDGGRLALLYAAVHALDAPHQAFVLGTWIPGADARADRFRALYGAHVRLLAIWDPVARPFVRSLYDGPHVLAMTAVDASGRALGPVSVRLWRKVFAAAGVPDDPAGELGIPNSEGFVDAAWLLQFLADVDQSFTIRRSRIEAWLFAQRAYDAVPLGQLPDVLVALRGFLRYGVLLGTLDRMGVHDPRIHAAAVRQADRLSRIKDRERAAVALGLFQASVSIVERARTARTLDVDASESLLLSLFGLPMTDDGEYLGGVGWWMDTVLLPAVASRLPLRQYARDVTAEVMALTADELLLPAMAGRALGLADSPDLGLWLEGLPYTVDVAAAELARMQAVRERQRGVPIEPGLQLARAASRLAAPGVTLAQVPQLAAELDRAARAVVPLRGPGMVWLDANWYRKEISSAAGDIRQLKKPGDLKKLPRIALPFLQVADRLLAQAALSLAYAAVLRDPQSTALMDGDPAPRHDWAFGALDANEHQAPSWREPVADRAGGWHLTGSILGADLALAVEGLRRVSVDRFPAPPTLSDAEQQTVAEGVSLVVPFDQSDADRDGLVGALTAGRRSLEAVQRQPALWPAAADAMQIRDFRRELLPWAIANEPDALPLLLSLGELVQLGQPSFGPATAPHAWGAPGRAYDGRWSLRYPVPLTLDLLAGRKGGSLTVGLAPDLMLSVAEAMHARRVPAALTRAVLECAARDAIDELQLQYYDDWITLIGHLRVVEGRLDEYLASLTSGGPLRPVPR
jgi:hypothetical protein